MFDNETLLFKYNIDANGNPISIKVDNEQKQVSINGTIQMEFVPDEFNRIDMLDENNQQMYEVFNRDEITTNTYYVDYSSGTIYYDKSQFGKVKIYNYYNRGLQLIGASRLYDEKSITGEGIVKTLQDIIDEGRKCLELIKSLGDAVIIINKLQKNLDDGNILHENLLEDISTGSAVRDDLQEKTDIANTTINSLVSKTQDGNNTVSQLIEKNTIATEKKQALDSSIQSATDTNTTLSNTNQAGTQINLTLQQTMAEASDDIATINATGNKSLIIGASNFTNGEYTWTHSMNNDNLIISILSIDTNEPIIADYKIIDKNNILIRNSEENPNIKVILSASYYQGNSVIGSTVEEFLGDSIGTDEDKVRLRGVNGEVQNPVTNSDAVFMSDGVTKLTNKISDITDEIDEARGSNQFLGDRLSNIDESLEQIVLQNGIFANDTLEIQNKINSGENVIGLEANKTYIVNTINIPDNRQITILGWNTYISTSDGVTAFKCGLNSNVKILGCRFNGGRTHSISDSSGRFDWQVYGGITTINTPNSTASALDIANFAGQNLTSNIPIGMVFHSYTDGNVFQIDNVGRNNVIITLKNAYNPTRRADKDNLYYGYGDYLRLTESYDDSGIIKGRDWFKITKDRKFSWLFGIADFVQTKIDDGIWAFRNTITNAHNNIYALMNGITTIFSITKGTTSKNETYTFTPSEANTEFIYSNGRKIENINKTDDGLYAVQTLIKNEHNYVWQMKNGNNEVLKITKNYTQINQLNLKPVIDLTTVTNNTLFIDGSDGKLKFKDSTGIIKIVNLT